MLWMTVIFWGRGLGDSENRLLKVKKRQGENENKKTFWEHFRGVASHFWVEPVVIQAIQRMPTLLMLKERNIFMRNSIICKIFFFSIK